MAQTIAADVCSLK